jgi:hypothetical protein
MKDSEWFDLLENPQGRLVRVLSQLFKHFSQFGSFGSCYPKGQIILMVSTDGREEQLATVNDGSKRLDEFYTSTFVIGTGAGSARSAAFIAMLDSQVVKIGLTIHDIEFIETAEE